jgi:choline dehydrogenase-like flavoprotein
VITRSLSDLPAAALRPDVAIVGAGATGIALAVLLARQGLRVTVIEGGPEQPPVTFRKANRAHSTGRRHLGIEEGRMKALGGTTRLWGGQLMPFGPGDLTGGTYAGKPAWPITHAALATATGRALELLRIPPQLQDARQVFKNVAGALPIFSTDVEFEVATWLPQPDFARLFADDLAHLPSLCILTEHKARSLIFGTDGKCTAVSVEAAGAEVGKIEAEDVVLANGTFELVATLLRTARNEPRCGFSNNRHIGRWFIDHLHAVAGTIRDIDPAALRDFGDPVLKSGHKFSVKLRLADRAQASAGVPNVAAMILNPLSVRDLLRELTGLRRRSAEDDAGPGFVRSLAMLAPLIWRYLVKRRGPGLVGDMAYLGVEVEQVLCDESRITLDPDDPETLVLNWAIDGKLELSALRLLCERLRDEFDATGLGRIEIDPRIASEDPAFLDEFHDAYHQMGGARMAASAEHGVVDPNLRVFGTENLFALGAATFPSGSFANPTLTALALAVRLSDHLAARHRS